MGISSWDLIISNVTYSLFGVTFTTDEMLAWGTIALVVVGALTLVANWRAIVAAKAAAQAAKTSAEAALAQVRIAYPILDISVKSIPSGSPMVTAHVRWLGGSLPAREVSFWVRGPSFVHHLSLPSLGPPDDGRLLQLPVTSPADPAPPQNMPAPLAAGKVWRLIRWTNPDDGLQERHGKIDSE